MRSGVHITTTQHDWIEKMSGSFSQQQINNMQQVGRQGGSINTNGMTYVDKQIADKAVADGRKVKK